MLWRTGLMTVYLLVFHRHQVANARVQSCTADDKQSCLFASISSVRQFCCRSNPTSLPTLPAWTATPKTVGVKELRFFSQIMQVRWPVADVFSRPIRSHSFLLDTLSHSLSVFLSVSLLSFAPTYVRSDLVSVPENSRVFVAPLCQPGLLPLLLVHCANSSTYSFIPPVLSHSCSRKVHLPANVSFYCHWSPSSLCCALMVIFSQQRSRSEQRKVRISKRAREGARGKEQKLLLRPILV